MRLGARGGACAALALALLAAGCAGPGARPPGFDASRLEAPGPLGECARWFAAIDRAVARAGVGDAQAARIPGFPHLRVNRLLASGVKPAPGSPAFEAWVEALAALDQRARVAELANLASREPSSPARAAECRERLVAADLADPLARRRLAEAATVPPAYDAWKRVVGLYPLTALAFMLGVERLHADFADVLETPLEALPIEGELVRYRPPQAERLAAEEVAAILARAADNPLGVPVPDARDRARLFAAFAPRFVIDVVASYDRLGTPYWGGRPRSLVDVRRPVVFRHLSHARLGGETLLQLNYVVWFPARPRTGPLDLLGGHLDGLTWRVTLDRDGRPLVHDAMHNCGCYHMVFPSERLRPVRRRAGFEEPLFVAPAPLPSAEGPWALRLAHRTHYLQKVHRPGQLPAAAGDEVRSYAFADYDALRSLPRPDGGRRSFFGPDGLVPGSERRERYLFWPMGVPEPGAMRQWGHHAVAFVGRRHFDDPDLFSRYFERRRPSLSARGAEVRLWGVRTRPAWHGAVE